MRTNTASKLKLNGSIHGWIVIIVSIVGGIKLMADDYVWLGWFAMFAGCFIGDITILLFNGLATLVDNSSYLPSLEKIEQLCKNPPSAPVLQPAEPQQSAQTPPVSQKTSDAQSKLVKPVAANKPDKIVCPNCGLEQNSTRTICWRCATKFQK